MEPLLVIVGIAVLIPVVFVITQFNQLVGLRNYIQNAWGNIDTELKRRYELIPNLVATVQGYAAHERQVLQSVTTLRARCVANQGSPETQAADERQLVAALQQLWAVAENYPDLKANQHFLELQRELVNTEDRIQAARRFYNGNVRDYQTKCQTFPSNLVAGLFGFKPAEYFTVSPSVREVPDVDFDAQ